MSTYTWKPLSSNVGNNKQYKNVDYHPRNDLNMTVNLVNEEWENLDPTPDIHSMFQRFDDRFFSSKLRCVELEWSKRMYSCAGICYSRRNGLGSAVTIRLSEPLLKLRPRKDLVQTLLHEMIHAFSFIRGIREGNGGHGPFFQQMMNDINKVAGTNISVYHTFHDEVNVYKKHVWRCNGICSKRKPFFGYVRRVANRAPGPSDQWWSTHQRDCGGYFQKVSEPDKVARKKSSNPGGERSKKAAIPKDDKNQPKISDIFGGGSSTSSSTTTNHPPLSHPPRPSAPLSNIHGFSDISSKESGDSSKPSTKSTPVVPLFVGQGNLLTKIDREIEQFKSIQEQVRNSWQKRFGGPMTDLTDQKPLVKRPKVAAPATGHIHQWQMVDDDIAIRTPYVETVDLLDSEEEQDEKGDSQLRDHNERLTEMANKTLAERKSMIRQELYDSDEGDEIEMIDDEFDDDQEERGNVGKGGNEGMAGNGSGVNKTVVGGGGEFKFVSSFSADDVVKCPICVGGVSRGYLAQHMEEGCLGITTKVAFVFNKRDAEVAEPSTSFYSPPAMRSEFGGMRLPRLTEEVAVAAQSEEIKYPCPNCGLKFSEGGINGHLDECLE